MCIKIYKKTKAPTVKKGLLKDWQQPTLPDVTPVPLALRGLTSLFGMGRGDHSRYSRHKILNNIMT